MIERKLRNIVVSGYGSKVFRENELIKIVTKKANRFKFHHAKWSR
jgi:hypothetical protein